MSFFCSDHHLFIAGAPRVTVCPRCGSCSYEPSAPGAPATGCRVCSSRSDEDLPSSANPRSGGSADQSGEKES